jgi:predicted TIM-barrel fold metal-dependent hydrolase
MKKSQPDLPITSPIPFTRGSNGEIEPHRVDGRDVRAHELFMRLVEEKSKRVGVGRREFAQSVLGTATALYVINTVYGCSDAPPGAAKDRDGGFASTRDGGAGVVDRDAGADAADAGYGVDAEAMEDAGMACEVLEGDEFIFDVQSHHVNPEGAWRQNNPAWAFFLGSLPQGGCGEADRVDCFQKQHYIREMFLNSDTAVAVLSAVPSDPGENPLEIEDAAETRRIMERLSDQSHRLLIHGLVLPDLGGPQLDGMQRLTEEMNIAAWKVYTPWHGWRLDDPNVGIPFIERARSLGVKRICAHKGLPLVGFDPNYASPDDIGVVAAAYPDVDFIVYHSGYDPAVTEGPYDANDPQGVDRLIKSLEDNNVGPGGNVYAELGTTWRDLMTSPTEAGHLIGKLMQHLGEDNIMWGTDSIWYGSPQDQIMAFRAFEVSAGMQMMYGYPALTPEAKRKIFGLNAARVYGIDPEATLCKVDEDELNMLSMEYREERLPNFKRYGPRSRREFFAFLKSRGGQPG